MDTRKDEPFSSLKPLLDVHIPSTRFGKDDLAFLEDHDKQQVSTVRLISKIASSGQEYQPVTVTQTEVKSQQLLTDETSTEQRDKRSGDCDRTTTSDWRPFVMRTPYITFIIVLSIALASGQEVLCQHTMNKGPLFTFDSIEDLPPLSLFCWRYLPAIDLIIYGIFVATLDHQVMRLAPFYKLGRPQGLRGSESLLREPANYFYYLRNPRKAGPLIWSSSLSSLIALVVIPPVQAASLVSSTIDASSANSADTYSISGTHKRYVVLVDPVWSRILSTALVLVACCMVSLMIFLRQPSNLTEHPYGIAGMVASMNVSDMQRLLTDLDMASTEAELKDRLSNHRFVLRNGCIEEHTSTFDQRLIESSTICGEETLEQRCIPPRYQLIVSVVLSILTPALCSITSLTEARVIVNTIPWFITIFAVSYKLLWGQFEVFLRTTRAILPAFTRQNTTLRPLRGLHRSPHRRTII